MEKEYINAVRTGAARQFIHKLHTIPNFEEDTGETWDDGQIETFLIDQADKFFGAETTVYNALYSIQGKLVPRLLARVYLDLSPLVTDIGHIDNSKLFYIKGVLL